MIVGLVGYHLLQGEGSSVHTPTTQDNANTLVRFLGQNAIKVVSCLVGLILAVIGV